MKQKEVSSLISVIQVKLSVGQLSNFYRMTGFRYGIAHAQLHGDAPVCLLHVERSTELPDNLSTWKVNAVIRLLAVELLTSNENFQLSSELLSCEGKLSLPTVSCFS